MNQMTYDNIIYLFNIKSYTKYENMIHDAVNQWHRGWWIRSCKFPTTKLVLNIPRTFTLNKG